LPWRGTRQARAQRALPAGDYVLGNGCCDGSAWGGVGRVICRFEMARGSSAGKFQPILDEIRARTPGFMIKTSELINRFSAAAQRYELTLKMLEARRKATAAKG